MKVCTSEKTSTQHQLLKAQAGEERKSHTRTPPSGELRLCFRRRQTPASHLVGESLVRLNLLDKEAYIKTYNEYDGMR